MEKHTIRFNGKIIEFEINRKNVKNINLNVRPDMKITVSVSNNVPLDYIEKFVRKKAPWILKNVSYFKETQADEKFKREYINGESYKYLGRQYRLKVIESPEEYVKYYRGFINLYVKDKNNFLRKENLLKLWFKQRTDLVFNESLERIYELIKKYKNILDLSIQDLICILLKQWGRNEFEV